MNREGVQADSDTQLEQILLSQRERAKTVRKHVTAEILALLTEVPNVLRKLAIWRPRVIHDAIDGFAGEMAFRSANSRNLSTWAVCGTVLPTIDRPWLFW